MKTIIVIALIVLTLNVQGQEIELKKNKPRAKAKFFMLWGYNRSAYSKSNYHFKGDGYDFELSDVVAVDKQLPFDPNIYLRFKNASIPQYNYKIGYHLKENLTISGGVDHMKYVMVQGQKTNATGDIYVDEGSDDYNGSYNDNEVDLIKDFLIFEHTDGLNYIGLQIDKIFELYNYKNDKVRVTVHGGGGFGGLMPRSNVTLLGKERYDEFHLAGYGLSSQAGIRITVFKNFFFHNELKGGFINLPKVRTTSSKSDKMKHSFWFIERFWALGFNFAF